jgi:hypothetical protein
MLEDSDLEITDLGIITFLLAMAIENLDKVKKFTTNSQGFRKSYVNQKNR